VALNFVYISDAILLTTIGIFLRRIHTISRQIEETIIGGFLEKHLPDKEDSSINRGDIDE